MDRPHANQFRGIRILQLNCGKSANITHACLETATKTADIVLLQEPRIGPWSDERGGFTIISHPSFTCLLPPGHNNNTIKPRVATFVSKTFPHLQVNIRPDRHLQRPLSPSPRSLCSWGRPISTLQHLQ